MWLFVPSHHKNGNKLDNRIENLEVKDPLTHGRDHLLIYPLTKICVICGSEFTPYKTKRKRKRTCSQRCRYILIGRRTSADGDDRRENASASGLGEAGRDLSRGARVAYPQPMAEVATDAPTPRSVEFAILAHRAWRSMT